MRAKLPDPTSLLHRSGVAILFAMPTLVLVGLFLLYPFASGYVLSLYEWNGLTAKEFVGLDNFRELLFEDKVFAQAFGNNIKLSLMTVGGNTVLGFLLALAIHREVAGWKIFRAVYFLPAVLPLAATGLLWAGIFEPHFGVANGLLELLGLEQFQRLWLGDMKLALYLIAAVSIWRAVGTPMLIFLAAMQNIPAELYDAAEVDGAAGFRRLWYITLPLTKSVVVTTVVLLLILSFKIFDLIWVMTLGGPGYATTVVGTYTFMNMLKFYKFGYGAAMSTLMSTGVVVFYLLYLRFVEPRDTYQY